MNPDRELQMIDYFSPLLFSLWQFQVHTKCFLLSMGSPPQISTKYHLVSKMVTLHMVFQDTILGLCKQKVQWKISIHLLITQALCK